MRRVFRSTKLRTIIQPRAIFALGFIWLLVGTAWGLHQSWSGPLTWVTVSGQSTLTQAQVAATAGLAVGTPLHRLDPHALSLRLMDHPRIAGAHVRKLLPGGLMVQVRERTPAAQVWFATGGIGLVDQEGVVLQRRAGLPNAETGETEDIPLIQTALPPVAPGLTLPEREVAVGIGLAEAVSRQVAATSGPVVVDIRRSYTYRVELPGLGLTLLLPVTQIDEALELWARIVPALTTAGVVGKTAAEIPNTSLVDLRSVVRDGPGWITIAH